MAVQSELEPRRELPSFRPQKLLRHDMFLPVPTPRHLSTLAEHMESNETHKNSSRRESTIPSDQSPAPTISSPNDSVLTLPSWTTIQDEQENERYSDPGDLLYPPSPSAISSSAQSSTAAGYDSDGQVKVPHDDGELQYPYPLPRLVLPPWDFIWDDEASGTRCNTDALQVVPSGFCRGDRGPSLSKAQSKSKFAQRPPAKVRRPRVMDSGRACDLCSVRKIKCIKRPEGGACEPCVQSNLICKTTREIKRAGRPPKKAVSEGSTDTALTTSENARGPSTVAKAPRPLTSPPAASSSMASMSYVQSPSSRRSDSSSIASSSRAPAPAQAVNSPDPASMPKTLKPRSSWMNTVLRDD